MRKTFRDWLDELAFTINRFKIYVFIWVLDKFFGRDLND